MYVMYAWPVLYACCYVYVTYVIHVWYVCYDMHANKTHPPPTHGMYVCMYVKHVYVMCA